MSNPVSNALAQRRGEGDGPVDAKTFVKNNTGTLAALLPTHLKEKGDSWARQVAGSLYRGSMTNGQYDLVIAAQNNPDAFMIALRQAAALGLTPGTEEYYLTPRKGSSGRQEILGIVGYQGYVELMYRAGAVSSVIVELVYQADEFDYMPGRDEVPLHKIDWRLEDRGAPWLVYAYARMVTGAVSKVIVMNEAEVNRIRDRSPSAKFSKSSPWHTDPGAMWMKTAVRQLRKWVPTSSEYLSTQLRAANEGQSGVPVHVPPAPAAQIPVNAGHQLQIDDPDEVIEAEVVPDPQPPAAEPENTPASAESIPEPTGQVPSPPITTEQKKLLKNLFDENKFPPNDKVAWLKFAWIALEDDSLKSIDKLTSAQAEVVAQALRDLPAEQEPPASEPAQ